VLGETGELRAIVIPYAVFLARVRASGKEVDVVPAP
jgi:hypothetical protein